MRTYHLTHLVDDVLLRHLTALIRRDRATTATMLAYIAEVDARKLYAPAGYPSMFAYCLAELHLSEDSAYKRIRAARTAREHPALFAALSDGRLHLSAVLLLTPHLTPGNADELIALATHCSRAKIEQALARKFPQAEALRLDDGVSPVVPVRPAPGAAAVVGQLAPGPVVPPRQTTAPLSPERFRLEITVPAATHEKLRYAQSLLGHSVPSGNIALVLDRALDTLIVQLERRKIAATRRPRRTPRPSNGPRHVPAHVRREVWKRHGGRCGFVSAEGHRCESRTRLEFDHADPVALGGTATVERIRLLCRTHNQLEAERVFGAEFMQQKRLRAPQAMAAEEEQTLDVIAGLRSLGLPAAHARRVAEASRPDHPVSLEERLRLALQAHRPRRAAPAGGVPRELGAASHPGASSNAGVHAPGP